MTYLIAIEAPRGPLSRAASVAYAPSMEQAPADSALMLRYQQGDVAAFETLYRSHVGRVMALCWRLCGSNPTLAEELAQDAFVRAWRKLSTAKRPARCAKIGLAEGEQETRRMR